jgi:hypothetical protein
MRDAWQTRHSAVRCLFFGWALLKLLLIPGGLFVGENQGKLVVCQSLVVFPKGLFAHRQFHWLDPLVLYLLDEDSNPALWLDSSGMIPPGLSATRT